MNTLLESQGAAHWGVHPSDWATLAEPKRKPLWVAMLRAGRVGWRTRVLDAGCGAGGGVALARGLGAEVTGIDACEPLLEIARRNPFARFDTGDLQGLPYTDASFDFVMAANSVGCTERPLCVARELRRVCASRGRIAIAEWAPQGDHRRVLDALGVAAPICPEDLLEEAGARVVGVSDAEAIAEWPDLPTAWRAWRSTGWVQSAIEAASEESVRQAFASALQPIAPTKGSVRMRQGFRLAVAVPA